MGSLIHVTCPNGHHDEDHAVGVGMLGIHQGLFACATCKALVPVDWELDEDPPTGCPTCGAVAPAVDDEDLEADIPCPSCSAPLELRWSGMWD